MSAESNLQQRGFTLIEIMVVMAIVGTFALAVTFTVSDSGRNSTEATAQTLGHRLQYAREFALVRHATMGLQLRQDEYRFVSWQPDLGEDGRWQLVNERGLDPLRLPAGQVISLERTELDLLEQEEALSGGIFATETNANESADELIPQLIIFPNGQLPRFRLLIRDLDDLDGDWYLQSEDGSNIKVTRDALQQP